MHKKHGIPSRWSALIQIMLVLSWLVNLQDSQSYLFVNALWAMAGCLSIVDNARNPSPSRSLGSCALAAAFSLASVCANHSLFFPAAGFMGLLTLLVSLLGGFFLLWNVIPCLRRRLPLSQADPEGNRNPRRFFRICFASIVLIDGLYLLLAAWPGILSADSLGQMGEICSGHYRNLNPYWHTKTIALFVGIGQALFGSLQAGVGLFSLFQILLFAAGASYVLVTLYQQRLPKGCIGLVWAAYALAHYNIAYSVTMWKDIPFSLACLVCITALYRILQGVEGRENLDVILFLLSGLGVCLWRTNGMLVYGVLLVTVLATLPRNGKLKAAMSCVLLVGVFLSGPFLSMQQIPGSDYVEAASIPLQQVARVVQEGKPLTDEEAEQIAAVADLTAIAQVYESDLSDPIKALVRSNGQEVISQAPGTYFRLWLRLGLRYPGAYARAWVDQTKGYWDSGYENYVVAHGIFENELGLFSQPGSSLISRMAVHCFRYIEIIPFLQPFYSIGLQCWLMILCCYLSRVRRNKVWILTLPWFSVLFGLLIGTPVFDEFRYAYPLILTLPPVLALTCFPKE